MPLLPDGTRNQDLYQVVQEEHRINISMKIYKHVLNIIDNLKNSLDENDKQLSDFSTKDQYRQALQNKFESYFEGVGEIEDKLKKEIEAFIKRVSLCEKEQDYAIKLATVKIIAE